MLDVFVGLWVFIFTSPKSELKSDKTSLWRHSETSFIGKVCHKATDFIIVVIIISFIFNYKMFS